MNDPSTVLKIGEFHLEPSARRLTRNGQRISIQQKPLDVLTYLVEHPERLVTREELLERFWPAAVNEEALTRCVSTIRKLLGDVRDPPRYIETLWGQGYRFIEAIEELPQAEESAPPSRLRAVAIGLTTLLLVVIVIVLSVRNDSDRPLKSIDRIAVLPISAPQDEEWTATALTDQLIRAISRIEGVAVVARGSTSKFSAASDPREVGERLNVDALLISVLDRAQPSPRLKSELVSTEDGSVLWSFAVEPQEALTDEGRILSLARAMARRLWANLQLREPDDQVDPEAYRNYLRGRYYWDQRTVAGLTAAIDSYNAALALEPEYVDAMTGLADSWLLMPLYGAVAPNDAIPRARRAAERALALDPGDARAHAVTGVIHMQYDWDWLSAESHLREALTLNPNDPTVEQWLGELNCYLTRFDECARHLKLAESLDPLSPILAMLRGSPALYAGRFDAAVLSYEHTLKELPDFEFTNIGLGHAFMGLEEWESAIASYETLRPELGLAIIGGPLIYALSKSGEERQARQLLQELEALSQRRYVPPSKLAIAHLGLGDRKQAIAWLRRAVEAHDDRLVYLAVDNVYADLHSDPDFREIAATIGVLDLLPPLSGFDVE